MAPWSLLLSLAGTKEGGKEGVVRSSSWFLCDGFSSFSSDCVKGLGFDGWKEEDAEGWSEREEGQGK